MADTYKVKSDYTVLRRKARQTSKGDVYENNLMTITPFETIMPEGQNIVYSDSNFKFSVRTDSNLKKRHSKSDWLLNPSGETEWTLDDIIDAPVSDESIVRIKPDYSSLRDFAYYGSAVEMVHATVNHVLMYFPGELYFSNDKFQATNKQGEKITLDKQYYIVYNECDINVDADLVDESEIDNPTRYLCLSIGDYELLNNGNFEKSGLTRSNFERADDFCDEGILGKVTINWEGSSIDIYVYIMAGQKFYLYTDTSKAGYSIRPNQYIINEYFATIDEFENVLLNRESKPIYKAVFETTTEKEDGYYYTMESYIWPSVNDWTPDMHSSAYQSYIMRLISLAEYHDEFDSNNIWRMMTHEAIKNLDWTFFRENGDGVEDMSNIDSSRIEAIMQLYGRQYDGLKRYIDNIKHSNKITYDQKNNIPDYLLTDTVENAGFDAILPNPTAKTSVETDGPLFCGLSKGYNEVDGNTFFMRNLKLNAPYLNSVKGTREGIEAMLGILGFSPKEYEISEYVTVANGRNDYCQMDAWEIFGMSGESVDRCSNCKYPSAIDVEMINQNKDSFPVNEFATSYQGIACKPIEVVDESGITKYRYVVPWYENGKYYDGDWYFQCDGGWGRQASINVSGMTILDQPIGIGELTETYDFSLFEETESRLKFAESLEEMLDIFPSNLEDGDICYVTDISNLKTLQDGVYSGISENVLSHYFIIKDKTNYCLLGESGWTYIPMSDITSSSPSTEAKKVIYLETIKDSTTGNNPHVAKRDYDGGKKYVECLDNIFKYNIETSGFSFFSDTDVESAITTYTFGISSAYTVDNRKAEYFRREEQSNLQISGTSGLREVVDFCPEFSGETIISTGICINPEGGDEHLEPAANSIINLKNIKIKFGKPTTFYDEWLHWLKTVVFKYLEQMLPSTCILRWEIGNEIQPEPPEPTPTLNVRPTSLVFPSGGSVEQITVIAENQNWSISNTQCNWVSVSKNGNGVSVSVGANPEERQRSCSFEIVGEKTGIYPVSVSQYAKEHIEQLTDIVLTVNGTPNTIPASGGSVDCSNITIKVIANYDTGRREDVTSSARIDCQPVSAGSKGTVPDPDSNPTYVNDLKVNANYEGFSKQEVKPVYQQANRVENHWEVSGITNQGTSGWTIEGNTSHVIEVNPSATTISSGGGSVDIYVYASAITEEIIYSADTYQKQVTPWSAYTSTASGNGETIVLEDIYYENERHHSETNVSNIPTAYSGQTGGLVIPGFNIGSLVNSKQTIVCENNTVERIKSITLGYYIDEKPSVTGNSTVTQEAAHYTPTDTRTIRIVPNSVWTIEMQSFPTENEPGSFEIRGPQGSTGRIIGSGRFVTANNTTWNISGSIEITTTDRTRHYEQFSYVNTQSPSPYDVNGYDKLGNLNGTAQSNVEIPFEIEVPSGDVGSTKDVNLTQQTPNLTFTYIVEP